MQKNYKLIFSGLSLIVLVAAFIVTAVFVRQNKTLKKAPVVCSGQVTTNKD